MQQDLVKAFYVVSTPIGNLSDITLRALEILKASDVILAEDTRKSQILFNYYQIKPKKILSCHEYNESLRFAFVKNCLQTNKMVSLISDAGTPIISDPGYKLVRFLLSSGFKVIPVPGASSLLAGLVASGLPANSFVFIGFLPTKNKLLVQLNSLKYESRTMIFFIAPHKLTTTIKTMLHVFGEQREVTIARELTKLYETIILTSLGNLSKQLETQELKGEVVLIVSGSQQCSIQEQQTEHVLTTLLQMLPLKQAVIATSKITNVPKNTLYQVALTYKTSTNV